MAGEHLPDTDDRAYLGYVGVALVLEVAGGLAIGVLMYLARTGVALQARLPDLVQAHGRLQLEGWAGLFVAGMAQRLVPRLAGRPPSRRAAKPILGLLAGGAVLRPTGQALGGAAGGLAACAGALLSAAGTVALVVVLAGFLAAARKPWSGWVVMAWSGCAWWLVWAGLDAWGGALGLSRGGLVPPVLDQWTDVLVTLGAIGSFVWAVQARMVPVFFGRRPPTVRRVLAPALAFNAGLAAVLGALLAAGPDRAGTATAEVAATGLAVAGLGLCGLALVAGAVSGTPHRLRDASRSLGRFVVSADRWAVACGLLWLGALAAPLLPGAPLRHNLEDAALHAFGTGVITMLIAGMLQLVAPVFARTRMGGTAPGRAAAAIWPLLWLATATRVAAGLAGGYWAGRPFVVLAALSGACGWLALVTLGTLVVAGARAAEDPVVVADS